MVTRLNKDVSYEITVPAGSEYFLDFESDTTTDKLAPFRNYTIQNIGNYAIKSYENGQNGFKYIAKGVIFERQDRKVSTLRFVNTDATNDASLIVTLDNDFSQVEMLRALLLGVNELK